MANTQVKYQAFVSSTYIDLAEERQAVTAALLELDAIPSGMELFPAADDDAWTLIKSVIDDCDYYLLVIGGRYGSVDPSDNLSFTEKEYDHAVSQRKPVMAFIHADPGSIPTKKTDGDDAAREALNRFKRKVQNAKHVKLWTSPEDLAGKVSRSFAKFTKQYPATGWVRADQQAAPEAISEILLLRKRIAELESQLEQSRVSPPTGVEELSQGDDPSDFLIAASAFIKLTDGQRQQISHWISIEPTWNQILKGIGPRLLQECEEGELFSALNEWLTSNFWYEVDIDEELLSGAKEIGLAVAEGSIRQRKGRFEKEDFSTILVQLVALGIVQKSVRKRSVSDRGTYWALTHFGELRVIQLTALTKGQRGEASDSTEKDKIESGDEPNS